MALKRPTSLLVFGILNITFGVIGIMSGLCGLGLMLSGMQQQMAQTQKANAGAAGNADQKELLDFQVRMQDIQSTPLFQANQIGAQVASLVLSTLLIIGGIGLVAVKYWARPVCIGYGVLSILTTLWAIVYTVVFLLPEMNALFNDVRPTAKPVLKMVIDVAQYSMYGAMAIHLVYLVYPALVLFWMMRPATVEALRKGGIPDPDFREDYPPERDEYPDYDDRPRDRFREGDEGITSK